MKIPSFALASNTANYTRIAKPPIAARQIQLGPKVSL